MTGKDALVRVCRQYDQGVAIHVADVGNLIRGELQLIIIGRLDNMILFELLSS